MYFGCHQWITFSLLFDDVIFVLFQEAAVNTLIGIEVACWFFVGECLGKRSLVGYNIKGAFNAEAHI